MTVVYIILGILVTIIIWYIIKVATNDDLKRYTEGLLESNRVMADFKDPLDYIEVKLGIISKMFPGIEFTVEKAEFSKSYYIDINKKELFDNYCFSHEITEFYKRFYKKFPEYNICVLSTEHGYKINNPVLTIKY